MIINKLTGKHYTNRKEAKEDLGRDYYNYLLSKNRFIFI
nr:MAG TPA: hypothetical protein [Caudoviricetes sp.]